jgi:hypothetical protein
VVSACLAALLLSGCGIGLDASYADPAVEATSLTECEPVTPYDDLDALSTALASEASFYGIVGADIATDVRLANSDIVFAFGDTILEEFIARDTSVRNSLLAFSADRACLVLGPDGSAFVPDRADGVGYWPTSMVEIEPGRTMALFLQRVRETSDGAFVNLGPSVAEVAFDPDGLPRLVRVIDIGADEPSRQRIGWGAASWHARDDYLYIYGTANPETELVFGWSLHVARVRPEQVFDVLAWEYRTADEWSPDASAVTTLIPASGGVSQTLSVFAQEGRWYAVSKRDDYLGRDIVIWSAAEPTGTFVASDPVAQRPSDADAGILRYAVLAHPTLYPQEGTLVVSISQNTTDPDALADDPTLYRPEFFRVPLPPG